MIRLLRRVNPKKNIIVGITWETVILLVLIILVGVMLAFLSVQVYRGYNGGMNDIGNMSQSIWSATQGRPLEFTYQNGQLSRLGLHIELIYFLLIPLYLIFPQPTTLLILQSVLFVLGAIPVFKITMRALKNPRFALALVIIYLFYPVAQTAILFDFHGDTLAMPLLLFGLNSLEVRHWKSFAFFIILSLSCKVYVAAPVFFIGIVILLTIGKQSEILKKVGFFTVLGALIWGGLAFFVLRPLFLPDTGVNLASASSPIGYFSYYFDEISNNITTSWIPRLGVLLLLIMPTIWLSIHSAIWLLPAAVTAIPALLSNDIQFTYYFHHYALAVPFLIYAAIKGVEKLNGKGKTLNKYIFFSNPQKMILLSILMTVTLNAALVDTPLNPSFWLSSPGKGLDSLRYGRVARDGLKDELLKEYIPPGVPIAVSWTLAPHLTNRETLYVLDYFDNTSHNFDIAIADGLFDYAVSVPGGFTGGVLHDLPSIRTFLQRPDLSLINVRDGLLFFSRGAQSENLLQTIVIKPINTDVEFAHIFNEKIGLIDSSIYEVKTGVYRFSFSWGLNQSLQSLAPLFAVSRLVDPVTNYEIENFRILHIPTEVIFPTNEWEPNEVIVETFDVPIPNGLVSGNYQIKTCWYTSDNIYSAQTDSRSQFGDEFTWGNISIP